MGKKEREELQPTEILSTPGIEQAAFDNITDSNQFVDISEVEKPKNNITSKKKQDTSIINILQTNVRLIIIAVVVIIAFIIVIGVIKHHNNKKQTPETDIAETTQETTQIQTTEQDVVESEFHESSEGAVAVINSYWDGYTQYDKDKMQKCFIIETELKKHVKKEESEAEYSYAEPSIVCLSEDKEYRQSHYLNETMELLKKETGLDIEEYNDYSLSSKTTLAVKDSDETSETTTEMFFTVIKVDGKYYLLGEPSVITR